MTLEAIHSSIYLPKQFDCLGVRLRPFSLGHALTMQALGLREVDDFGKLALATLVCSFPAGEVTRRWGSLSLGALVRWRAFVSNWHLAWLRLRYGPLAVIAYAEKENRAFIDYCDHYNQSPCYRLVNRPGYEEDDESVKSGCPFLEHLLVVLKSKLGYSESEAMQMPMNTAMMRYLAWLECEGRIDIIDDEKNELEASMVEEADQMHEERLAKANATLQ